MAFLDNSGDIILDAVLTDTGRYRLAKGDGSFKIVSLRLEMMKSIMVHIIKTIQAEVHITI